jgi:8-oxo-dGTP pyrophosphatase MutT (NUDIX family)
VTEPRIRPKAVCVCRRGGDILVGRAYDELRQQLFYVPPGGGIEFGERADDAVRREFVEELGAELADVTLLAVLENIYTYDGVPGHEIAFVFEGRLVDAALYERDEIDGVENGAAYVACWLPLSHFEAGGPSLYPDGLLALLRGAG